MTWQILLCLTLCAMNAWMGAWNAWQSRKMQQVLIKMLMLDLKERVAMMSLEERAAFLKEIDATPWEHQ